MTNPVGRPRKIPVTVTLDPDEITDTPHELFPADDGSEARAIDRIQVTRIEHGNRMFSPMLFDPADLPDLASLASKYGGGRYELIGRYKGHVVARTKYDLPGAPKPMYDEEDQKPANVAALPQQINPAPQGADMMQMFMVMMQTMMQSQSQMMLALMNGSGDRSKEYVHSMQALHDRHAAESSAASQNMLAMVKELAVTKTGGGESSDNFFRGVEFMRTFTSSQIENAKAAAGGDDGLDGLLGTLMQAVQGFQAFQNMPAVVPVVAAGVPIAAAGVPIAAPDMIG